MSRVGKRVTTIPEGVEITVQKSHITVKGPLGTLEWTCSPLIEVAINDQKVVVTRTSELKTVKQLHGTTTALIQNMVIGVTKGYKKELLIKGVGYKMELKGDALIIHAGYSKPQTLQVIAGIKVEIKKLTEIIVSGISKQKVGQMSALIRDVRRPNPYTGKGIMYKDEKIIRKEGKAAGK